jgi:hypothetical protein
MPCFSSVQKTKMENADRLFTALTELGMKPVLRNSNVIVAGSMTFARANGTSPFQASGDTTRLSEVGRKYGELSVRSWASRKGMSIVSNDGKRIELVNRRVY